MALRSRPRDRRHERNLFEYKRVQRTGKRTNCAEAPFSAKSPYRGLRPLACSTAWIVTWPASSPTCRAWVFRWVRM